MNEKNIIRTNKRESEKPFVMIERSIFEATELSWRAKGLLGYLLSRPDDWSVCVADLINRSTDGRDSCYAALKELGDAGYIAKSARPKQAGRFGGFEYVVFEKPVSVPQDVSPVGKTAYGLPVSGETVSGKTDTTYKDYTNNESTNNKNTAPRVASTPKKQHKKAEQLEALLAYGCSEQLANDWLEIRKAKGSTTLTKTVLDRHEREAKKAGLTPAQAVEVCLEKEWRAFTASWNWQDTGIGGTNIALNQPALESALGGVPRPASACTSVPAQNTAEILANIKRQMAGK